MQVGVHLTMISSTQFQLVKEETRKKRKEDQDRNRRREKRDREKAVEWGQMGTYVVSEPL